MADKENNCGPITRAAKKRAALAEMNEQPVTKKRVVLGELPNWSNVVAPGNSELGDETQRQKTQKRQPNNAKKKRRVSVRKQVEPEKETICVNKEAEEETEEI